MSPENRGESREKTQTQLGAELVAEAESYISERVDILMVSSSIGPGNEADPRFGEAVIDLSDKIDNSPWPEVRSLANNALPLIIHRNFSRKVFQYFPEVKEWAQDARRLVQPEADYLAEKSRLEPHLKDGLAELTRMDRFRKMVRHDPYMMQLVGSRLSPETKDRQSQLETLAQQEFAQALGNYIFADLIDVELLEPTQLPPPESPAQRTLRESQIPRIEAARLEAMAELAKKQPGRHKNEESIGHLTLENFQLKVLLNYPQLTGDLQKRLSTLDDNRLDPNFAQIFQDYRPLYYKVADRQATLYQHVVQDLRRYLKKLPIYFEGHIPSTLKELARRRADEQLFNWVNDKVLQLG